MPTLRGKQVPDALRKRGIRWINPDIFRLNFEHEHSLYEKGLRDGYVAAKGESPSEELLSKIREDAFEKHCHRSGFSVQELASLTGRGRVKQ
jgi:hypothetical protein